jgi:hypothetical protein
MPENSIEIQYSYSGNSSTGQKGHKSIHTTVCKVCLIDAYKRRRETRTAEKRTNQNKLGGLLVRKRTIPTERRPLVDEF